MMTEIFSCWIEKGETDSCSFLSLKLSSAVDADDGGLIGVEEGKELLASVGGQ